MAVRRNTRSAAASRREPARQTRKAAPSPAVKRRDVTVYATKEPTPYHKAFATWIVKEVGLRPSGMTPKEAFLAGVSIATAARPAFNESDYLSEWRERTGETKRGPKPRTEVEEAPKARTSRSRKAAPEPELEDDDDDFEDDDEEFDAEDDASDDDDFDDDDDDSDEDDDSEDDDEFDDDEDDEPEPVKAAPKTRTSARGRTASNSRARSAAPARKAASKPAGRKAATKSDDDEFLF